jgi:hypothetical protein
MDDMEPKLFSRIDTESGKLAPRLVLWLRLPRAEEPHHTGNNFVSPSKQLPDESAAAISGTLKDSST